MLAVQDGSEEAGAETLADAYSAFNCSILCWRYPLSSSFSRDAKSASGSESESSLSLEGGGGFLGSVAVIVLVFMVERIGLYTGLVSFSRR